jgi:hypothetical protein
MLYRYPVLTPSIELQHHSHQTSVNLSLLPGNGDKKVICSPTISPVRRSIPNSITMGITTTFKMSTHNTTYWLLLVIAIALSISSTSARRVTRGQKAGKSSEPVSFPYLYATRNDLNASYPVLEYIAPTNQKQLENDKPNFLYDQRQGYRIVVFVS